MTCFPTFQVEKVQKDEGTSRLEKSLARLVAGLIVAFLRAIGSLLRFVFAILSALV